MRSSVDLTAGSAAFPIVSSDEHRIELSYRNRCNRCHQARSSSRRLDRSPVFRYANFIALTLFFLSAATLLFEIDLSRLLSVSQFYHFAFMVVSLALLGYGASGTALSIFPSMLQKPTRKSLAWLSLASGISILGSYALVNQIPFDSFSIAWDRHQVLVLGMHYLALTLPFFFNGLAVGLLLAIAPEAAGRTYAANLLGSAVGCALALISPAKLGGEGVVVLSSGLAFLAAICALVGVAPAVARNELTHHSQFRSKSAHRAIAWVLTITGLLLVITDLGLRLNEQAGLKFLALHLSPYKSLSYVLQQPGVELLSQEWNAYSRVDVLSSPAIHSFPGLSYRYLEPLPAQHGLLVDGDDLSPILATDVNLEFSQFLPNALAFELKPQADTLVLAARGGLDVVTALALGAWRVDAVEFNPLIVAAVPVFTDPRVQVWVSDQRSYLRSTPRQYDVIVLALNSAFHPVRSGAYSLAEDYRYTVEAFEDALARLNPDGVLVLTRWLQNPPSEDLRTFALAVEALERQGLDPSERVAAFRGYNTATFLIKASPFEAGEISTIRRFASERAFDLNYLPGISPEETNRYNILPESIYYQAYKALLDASPRQAFYRHYPYEVSPPTDDRPFFGHFFRWSQLNQVMAELGKTWQPFGGAGYFVIMALLILAIGLAAGLILLPLFLARRRQPGMRNLGLEEHKISGRYLVYFGLIGLAYLLVEIPLIQKFILFLGHPAYAMSAILFTLLFFSGIGSLQSKRIALKLSLSLLVVLLLAYTFLLPSFFSVSLGLSFSLRLLLTVILLAPVGLLMGIPLPAGIRRLESEGLSVQIPWFWAVNGSASVISAVLAALLALTFGFNWVLRLGALCYAGALLVVFVRSRAQGVGVRARVTPSPVNGTNDTAPRL